MFKVGINYTLYIERTFQLLNCKIGTILLVVIENPSINYFLLLYLGKRKMSVGKTYIKPLGGIILCEM